MQKKRHNIPLKNYDGLLDFTENNMTQKCLKNMYLKCEKKIFTKIKRRIFFAIKNISPEI